MSKRIPTKGEPDCTGIGKWLGWIIFAIVVGACIAGAIKARGQGFLGAGGLLPASAENLPKIIPRPLTNAAPVVLPEDCDGDATPPVDTSDGLIISTTGSSGGSGTVGSPISLASALSGTATAVLTAPLNKRKLYMRGGTYTGRFNVNLLGVSGNPWIFLPYPGERPVLNQMSTANAVGVVTYHVTFLSPSAFLTFRGIEFTDKNYTPTNVDNSGQDDSEDAQSGSNAYHGGIKVDDADGITFENCVIHDQSGSGILTGSTDARNITIRGCLFYNIGISGNGKHHGLYLYNEFFAAPNNSRHIIDGNIFMNHAGYAIQLFGTSSGIPISGIYCSNNIIRDSAGQATFMKSAVTLWDGHSGAPPGQDIRFVGNVVSQLGTLQFLLLRDITNTLIFGNYFQLGAGQFLFRGTWSGCNFKTNTLVSAHTSGLETQSAIAASSLFDFNTYKMTDATPFNNNGAARTFAQWQSDTADEANSTWVAATNTGLTIKYVPNKLDTNLVYFAILNEANLSTVDIDLTPYWPAACGTYEIRNAGNHAGSTVSSGAWTGQSAITITMTGQTYAQPVPARSPTWVKSVNFFAGVARRIRAHPTAAEPTFP